MKICKKNFIQLLLVGLLLLLGCAEKIPSKLMNIEGLMPDLSFDLIDENEKQVTGEDFVGSTALMFFGFTSCPEICPATMGKLATVIKQLGEQAKDVKVLLISIDPKRDSPLKLKNYTNIFGPEFIGLTGTEAELRELTKRYRVTYGYGDADKEGNYEVSHSSAVFVFDNKGKPRLLATQSTPLSDIVDDLKVLLASTS